MPKPLLSDIRDWTCTGFVPIFCEQYSPSRGPDMAAIHGQKQGRRHHYYVSNQLISGGTYPTGLRLGAMPTGLISSQ